MIKFNIKMLRLKNNNMQQKELIELTHIRPATLSQLENNRAKTISIEQIDRLCQAFHCNIADLIEYIPDNTNHKTEE